jgi:hypothetical protein
MPFYSCFLHPKQTSAERQLTDRCDECGKPFNFPLVDAPSAIAGMPVVRSLSRGFYGATFVVKTPPFSNPAVVKVVPTALYEFFKKSFKRECEIHNELAQGSEHIVAIRNMGKTTVKFGSLSLPCHYAQMDFADGASLRDFLDSAELIPSPTVAQITIDLYRLLGELARHKLFHNDLHAGNLIVEKLPDSQRRPEAVDDNVRVKAVDLGSVSDKSASDPLQQRLGDVRWAASHIKSLVERLLQKPDEVLTPEYRLATLLEEHCYLLDQDIENNRLPTFEELENQVKDVVLEKVTSPWRQPITLRRFSDAYNAQTLYSWHVPRLIVDPNGQWLARLTTRGPLVLTGMRGCGKTIVLRSADFHARACAGPENEGAKSRLKRLSQDGFVGFYLSATRLLGSEVQANAKLYIAYVREILLAIEHMRDIDAKALDPDFLPAFREAVAVYIKRGDGLLNCGSTRSLDRKLFEMQVALNRGDTSFELTAHPADAFPHLADAVRKCAGIWRNHSVFFLLDDVSTRYLDEASVKTLVSDLLFSNEKCSFKFTTEAQTLELVLHAPGQHSVAWAGRDYDVFDLGYEVHDKINTRGKGPKFLEDILIARSGHYASHPANTPKDVLGSVSLEEIAMRIASTTATSAEKKTVYHGREALAGVCVGDIGDVIMLYEDILRRGASQAFPVPPEKQSECYQAFCSRRLYDLNRRHGELKDFALTFAEASHELLDRSYRTLNIKKPRLRQYTKLYVMVTSGNKAAQFQKLRQLIDAGVFVLEGGTETPRTKTRDSDPITQFKLSYRKLFGLSNFIPLADRDRFELSGDQLEEWLTKPAKGKKILLQNLTGHDAERLRMAGKRPKLAPRAKIKRKGKRAKTRRRPARQSVQLTIDYGQHFLADPKPDNVGGKQQFGYLRERIPTIRIGDEEDIARQGFDSLVVGLGFEERTVRSLRRILAFATPKRALCIRYREPGKSAAILRHLRAAGCTVTIADAADTRAIGAFCGSAPPLIDVSGLSKPLIFHSIRTTLLSGHACVAAHGVAAKHFPSNEEITKEMKAHRSSDHYGLLDALARITKTERKPYTLQELLPSNVDESRARALCAFVSAKPERLLTLLDQRDYDRILVGIPDQVTPRSKLAAIAADIIAQNYPNTSVANVGRDDVDRTTEWLITSYHSLFVDEGCNVEVSLTGSKVQSIIAAALSTVLKFSACWYVSPASFNPRHFSAGYAGNEWLIVSPTTGASAD